MNLKERMAFKMAEGMAGSIDKSYFLDALKIEWGNHLPKDSEIDIEKEVEEAWIRVELSQGFKFFKKVGVTKEDLRLILEEIKSGS